MGVYAEVFAEQLIYMLSSHPGMVLGCEKVSSLHAYVRGYYDAMELAYEKDLIKENVCYPHFSSYCKSIIGVEIGGFADYLINKHPGDEKAAFNEYVQHIKDYLQYYLRTRKIIHKFGSSSSKSAFIRKVKKWINDNPSACVEHLVLKEEIAESEKTASYKGYVYEYRLDSDIKEEKEMIEETKRILGHSYYSSPK